MVFRFNLTIEIPAYSKSADNTSLATAQPTLALPGEDRSLSVLQFARQHPRFSLRTLAFIAVVAGLILNSIVQQNFWYYSIRDLCSVAFPLLCVSLVWHPLDLFWMRLSRRPLSNWLLIPVETLGFLAFLALFISSIYVIADGYQDGSLSSSDVGGIILFTWNTVPWLILSIIDLICMVQGIRQAIRDKRISRCPNCREYGKGSGDEEESAHGNRRHSGEEPEHTSEVEERYRDEES